MSAKARIRALEEEEDDEELSRLLEARPPSNTDRRQWLRDENGDLDWAYTADTVRNWTQDALVTHLWANAFSVPPREYNPSAPFVYVKFHNGESVTLPHGYRLPLAFVAKYLWEMTLDKIKDEKTWKKDRAAILHLSRLCQNLFQRARAKAFSGGMEKGWRCEMFDRLLARLYKSWVRNDPQGIKDFATKHSLKEYDRDVLKHDWKRWCMRGLNGVRMREEEVIDGLFIDDFRKTLKKGEDGVWSIDGRPLSFITYEREESWSTTSDLTDFDVEEREESIVEAEGEVNADEIVVKRSPSTIGDESEIVPKRERDSLVDEDDAERESKRVRIGNSIPESHKRYRFNHIYPLSRTLAAMHSNPIWSRTSPPTSAPPTASSSKIPVAESISMAAARPRKLSSASDDVVIVSGPAKSKPVKKHKSTVRTDGRAQPLSTSSSLIMGRKPSKPRQTRAAQIAGVATVNLYVSDGKPRGGTASASQKTTNKWQALTTSTSRPQYRGKSSSQKKSSNAITPMANESKLQDAILPSLTSYSHSHSGIVDAGAGTSSSHEPTVQSLQNVESSSQPTMLGSLSNHGQAEILPQTFESCSNALDSLNSGSPSSGAMPSPNVNSKDVPSLSARMPLTFPPTQSQTDILAAPVPSTSAPSAAKTLNSAAGMFYPLPTWRVSPPPPHSTASKMPSTEPRREQQYQPTANVNSAQATLHTASHNTDGDIAAKALELLVNLIDAKQVLGDKLPISASSLPAGGSSGSHGRVEAAIEERGLLESRINDVEGRFASVKEELAGILGRLQFLENESKQHRAVGVMPHAQASRLLSRTGKEHERLKPGEVDVEMSGPECQSAEHGSNGQIEGCKIDVGKDCSPSSRTFSVRQKAISVSLGSLTGEEEKEALGATGPLSRQGALAETQTNDHISGGSEADTDTTVNVTGSTSGSKEEVLDPRAQAMGSNLSLLVDNLVSVKMLSLMETMVKSKVKDSARSPDIERGDRSVSPSIIAPTPDPFLVTNLVDELRVLKNDLREKERRERQEMEEMRRLHVAEVDALRRRLSYLESQNRYLENQAQNQNSSSKIRSSSTHPDERRNLPSRLGESSSSSKDRASTPAISERNYSFSRPDREDELPLPIKSQRKNISFPRPSFG